MYDIISFYGGYLHINCTDKISMSKYVIILSSTVCVMLTDVDVLYKLSLSLSVYQRELLIFALGDDVP
jgi:hypothetical protein